VSPHREPLRLWTIDKLVVAVFVVFLLSGEARDLLSQSGLRWAYLLLLSFGVGFIVTPIICALAPRLGAVDVPAGRKAHGAPTALLGGVAIYIAFAVTVLRNFAFTDELKGIVLAGTLILMVGLVDDLRELPARWKLVAQLTAVAILIRYGVVITFLPDTLWGTVGEWLLTAFWVVGITNAVNFLDGMDGLAAGSTGINAMFFGLVAWQNSQYDMMFLALPLLGACLSFLVYNFRPGRRAWIFLGDAGSTFLGFMMAALAVMGDWASHHTVGLIVPILILGVPIFDMTFTTVMRVGTGRVRNFHQWIEFTGRDHIHHRLEDLRIGRVGAVLIIYVVSIWLGLSALALKNTTGINALLQVAQSVIVFLLLGYFMVFVRRQYSAIADGAIDDAFAQVGEPADPDDDREDSSRAG
jgi:UDP-GlcNAc:undecaprenyl-phosphate GlcNAc-1-phosphate transferase